MRATPLPPGVSAGFLRLGESKPYPSQFIRERVANPEFPVVSKPIEIRASPAAPADMSLGVTKVDREVARQQGYTGDQCDNCSSTRMKISGHCMVCEACGTTTGCS